MWEIGVIVGVFMPAQRREALKQTMIICTIYYLALMGLKVLFGIASGVNGCGLSLFWVVKSANALFSFIMRKE